MFADRSYFSVARCRRSAAFCRASSQTDGRAYTDGADHTCSNWTNNGAGAAQVGHFDRTGGGNTSWNSAHASRGCSQANLVSTGGAGLLYCFAVN